MSKIIIMVGIPGSGKTTFAKALADEEGYAYLSSDEIRKDIINANSKAELVKPESINYHTFKIMNSTAVKLLRCDLDVIYDATNLNRKDRKSIIKEVNKLREEGYEITITAFVLNTPSDVCIERNNAREENKVPDDVMMRYIEKFTRPILDEGFDMIVEMKGE